MAFNGGKFFALSAPLGVGLLGAFMWVESRAPEPLLPLELFRRRLIAVSSLIATLLGAAMLSMVTFVPLFVQAVLGKTAVEAGSVITPMVIGWPIASTISGRLLPAFGFRRLIRIGLALSAVSAAAVALLLSPNSGLVLPAIGTACFGAGIGFANTPLLIAVQSSVDWKQRGVATASTMFFRTVGGALSIGALGAILAAALSRNPSIPVEAANRLLGPDHGASLGPQTLQQLSRMLTTSLTTIFWLIFALSVLAFVVSLAFPRLSTKSPALVGSKQVPQLTPLSSEP